MTQLKPKSSAIGSKKGGPSEEDELISILGLMRDFRFIRRAELNDFSRPYKSTAYLTGGRDLFPRSFLLKLLDLKLQRMEQCAVRLVGQLLNKTNLVKKVSGSKGSSDDRLTIKSHPFSRLTPMEISCPHFDQFFHQAVDDLYYGMINLNWPRAEQLDNMSLQERDYVKNKLPNFASFLNFRPKLRPAGPVTPPADIKNSNSQSPNNSFNKRQRRRRVRWQDKQRGKTLLSPPDSPARSRAASPKPNPTIDNIPKDNKDNSSHLIVDTDHAEEEDDYDEEERDYDNDGMRRDIGHDSMGLSRKSLKLALELLLYSINLFINHLCSQVYDFVKTKNGNVKAQIEKVKHQRNIPAKQLELIALQIKLSYELYLIVLDHSRQIRTNYLEEQVIGILCPSELDKELLVRYFIKQMRIDIEQVILDRLADLNSMLSSFLQ